MDERGTKTERLNGIGPQGQPFSSRTKVVMGKGQGEEIRNPGKKRQQTKKRPRYG
jgi:hypothetical protein